jgi:hypothetical protein
VATPFDAYYTWLGIPPEEQPPNHYRLLGIKVFESNREVIQHASDRQMAHLKSFNNSQNAALAQRLLNELSSAALCLLNAERKQLYDQQLKVPPTFSGATHRPPTLTPADVAAITAQLPRISIVDPLTTPLATLVVDSLPAPRGRHGSRGGGPPPWIGVAVVGAVALVLFIVAVAILSSGGSETEAPAGAGTAVQQDRG